MTVTIDKTFDETIKLIKQIDSAKFDDELEYFGLNRTRRQIFLRLEDLSVYMLVYITLNGLARPRYVLFQ